MSKTTDKFPPEVRERAVRMVLDNQGQHGSRWQAITSVAAEIGCSANTLNGWVRKAEVDSGQRSGISSDMGEKTEPLSAIGPRTMARVLERENRELRQADEILRKASACFAMAELDRRSKQLSGSSMIIVVDMGSSRSARFCRSPHPPTTITWRSGSIRPVLSDRARRDAVLPPEIKRVFEETWHVYGVRKVWPRLDREGFAVARRTVARLMKDMGIQGIIRGKPHKTTIPDKKAPCPLDKVNRQFRVPAPNMLWVSDFTYVATWRGFVCAAFVIDAYARRIVGWRASQTAPAGFVLDALEQAVHDRRPVKGAGLVRHSDRGSQYLSIKYTERLAEGGIEPSVGSVGDSYDNAPAETIKGLFKAEDIHRRGPWRSFEAVEYATLEWVDRFNNRRLPEPIGNIPPAKAEANFHAALEAEDMAA